MKRKARLCYEDGTAHGHTKENEGPVATKKTKKTMRLRRYEGKEGFIY